MNGSRITERWGLAVVTLTFLMAGGAHATDADLYKTWKTEEGGFVTFGPCTDDTAKACGTVSGLAANHEGPPPLDVHNPDAALQSRPLLGLVIFTGFEYRGKQRWKDGEVYNTNDGKTYDGKLRLLDDGRLKVSGCVSFFCQSYKWDPAPDQPAAMAGE